MVEEMLAEHKAKMLEVFLDKVKDEVQMFAVATNDAMDSFVKICVPDQKLPQIILKVCVFDHKTNNNLN